MFPVTSIGLTLSVPTSATVNVAGNTYNFAFAAQNLSSSAATTIDVAGNITYRSFLTSVTVPGALPAGMLNPNMTTDPVTVNKIIYDPVKGTLTMPGPMNASDLAYLLNPSVLVFDSYGQPVLNANGVQETTALTLNTAQQAAIQQLYTASQTAVVGGTGSGLHVAGPGLFTVTDGNNVDLGASDGILVTGPAAYLTKISPYSAALEVVVGGDLSMTETTIANLGVAGSVSLQVGGNIDVGVQNGLIGDQTQARGIFTTGGGGVMVVANGDINVDGSRIATYNGGKSRHHLQNRRCERE